MAKILIVEDELATANAVADFLTSEKHIVELSHDGEDARARLQSYQYDLLVVDWNLPLLSGIELCRHYRRVGGTIPILMLTGNDQIEDKEAGFDAGADDYLTKPFSIRELSARVRALLRRPGMIGQSGVLQCGEIVFDLQTNRVSKDGVPITLLAKEYALLEFFLRHQDQVFSVDALIDHVWTADENPTAAAIRQCISRLRAKIDKPGEASYIRNVIGVGYTVDRRP